MRLFKVFAVASLFFASICAAQTSTLTGTLTDSNGTVWANATWSAKIFNPTGGPLVYTGSGSPVPTNPSGALDGSGVFSGAIPDNSKIVAQGTQWILTICSHTSAPCSTLPAVAVTGTTYNMGAYASTNVIAPRVFAGSNAFAYSSIEVTAYNTGSTYYDVTLAGLYVWDGSTWTKIGGSSGGCVSDCVVTDPAANVTQTITQQTNTDFYLYAPTDNDPNNPDYLDFYSSFGGHLFTQFTDDGGRDPSTNEFSQLSFDYTQFELNFYPYQWPDLGQDTKYHFGQNQQITTPLTQYSNKEFFFLGEGSAFYESTQPQTLWSTYGVFMTQNLYYQNNVGVTGPCSGTLLRPTRSMFFCTGTTNIVLPVISTIDHSNSYSTRILFFKTDATGINTITAGAGDNIAGKTTYTLSSQYQYVELVNEGTTWIPLLTQPRTKSVQFVTVAGCTTGTGTGDSCATTITWNPSFTSASSYGVTCSGNAPFTSGSTTEPDAVALTGEQNQTAGSVQAVTTSKGSGEGASFGTITCIGVGN